VHLGWNTLAGPSSHEIIQAVNTRPDSGSDGHPYGEGNTSKLIGEAILSNFKSPTL